MFIKTITKIKKPGLKYKIEIKNLNYNFLKTKILDYNLI